MVNYPMSRNLLGWIWTLVAICSSTSAFAQLTTAEAGRLGLEPRWTVALHTSLQQPGKTTMMIWQSATPAKTSIEILAEGKKVVLDTNKLGEDGKPIGLEGAKAEAEMMAKRMKFAGLKPVIKESTSPNIYLLVTASDGSVEMLDAETGQSLWMTHVGKTSQPTMPAMMNDKFVVVTNGSTVYGLETLTGKSVFSFRSEDSPGAAATEINGRIVVPSLTGKLIGYLTENQGIEPSRFVYGGRSIVRPAVNRNNHVVAVPVEPRFVFFFRVEPTTEAKSVAVIPTPVARLEAQGPIVTTPVAYEDSFIVCSRSGEIFRIVPDVGGDIKWVASTGSVLYTSPLVAQNGVFIVTDAGELLAYDATNGQVLTGWDTSLSGMKQVLSVTSDRVFARSKSGSLTAIDRASGRIVGNIGSGLVNGMANSVSDRVYVVTNQGTLQCLAQKGMVSPLIHQSVQMPPAGDEGKEKPAPAAKPNTDSDADNPFGGADSTTDPGMETPAGDDPFGDG